MTSGSPANRQGTQSGIDAEINDDALVEMTPNAIRLRKRYLYPHERKRQPKAAR